MSLGHEFQTDVLELQFSGAACPGKNADKSLWYSLVYALLEGVSRALNVERRDIDGCMFVSGQPTEPPAVILFDSVPGGAGHVLRAGASEELRRVLQAALDTVRDCECDEDTSCFACLRNYDNQYLHEQLRRGPVRRFLDEVIAALYPSDAAGAVHVADRSRWAARRVVEARRAIIVAPTLPVEVTDGAADWPGTIRKALERGAQVSLVLLDEKLEKPFDVKSGKLLDWLGVLVDKGLRLYLAPRDLQALPTWPIYVRSQIDGERLIGVADMEAWRGQGLRALEDGEVRTWTEVEAVTRELRALEALLSRCDTIDAANSVFKRRPVRRIEVENKMSTSYDELFGELFTPDVSALKIEDPHVYSTVHVGNVEALLEMVAARCKTADRQLPVSLRTRQRMIRKGHRQDEVEVRVQSEQLEKLRQAAVDLGIFLSVELVSGTNKEFRQMHDRAIVIEHTADSKKPRLDIHLLRGLDIFDGANPRGRGEARQCSIIVLSGD